MSMIDIVKTMSQEDALSMIASSGMKEYGVNHTTVAENIAAVLKKRRAGSRSEKEAARAAAPMTVVAALNNSDTTGILLDVLIKFPEKVMKGISILAYAIGAEEKFLQLPEYAKALAEEPSIKAAAQAAGVTVTVGLVDVRANAYNVLTHIITMYELPEVIEDNYVPGIYVSVNDGELIKYSNEKTVREVLEAAGSDVSEVKAYETGYVFANKEVESKKLEDAQINNGVLRVLSSKNCMIQETQKRVTASRQQSCGKCVFCREGLNQLQGMLSDIKSGKGKMEYMDIIREIGSAMTFSTPCSLGQESAKAALSSIALYANEYEEHIKKKSCAAGLCFNKLVIYIDPYNCEGCEECADVCPADCIEGKKGFIHMIDEFDCTQCGKCIEVCECGAIIQTNGRLPKLPDRLTKVGRFKKH